MDWASECIPGSGDKGVVLAALKGELDGIDESESPIPGISGVFGEGINTVFRTSLRPRFKVGLRGVATCCACYIRMSVIQ